MPSHIFARLGLWQDDIDSNLASIAATRKTAAMHMGGEGHQFHAMDFLVYAYLQSGREAEAQRVIEEVKTLPAMKSMYGEGYDPQAYALSKFPALYALELHHWTEAAALTPAPNADSTDKAITYWARAIGAARAGNVAEARKNIAELETIRQEMLKKKKSTYAQCRGGCAKRSREPGWPMPKEKTKKPSRPCVRSPKERNPAATNLRTFPRARCWPICCWRRNIPSRRWRSTRQI